jgi:hypothetical protein
MWGGLAYAYKYVSLNLSLIQGAHFTHSNMVSEQEKEQRRVDSRTTECTAVGAWIGLETSCLLPQIAAGDMEASGSSDNDLEVNRSGDNYMEVSGFGDNGTAARLGVDSRAQLGQQQHTTTERGTVRGDAR